MCKFKELPKLASINQANDYTFELIFVFYFMFSTSKVVFLFLTELFRLRSQMKLTPLAIRIC